MDCYFNLINLSNWSTKQANSVMRLFDPNSKIQNHFYSHHYERRFGNENSENSSME
jgi:hypothetical protein